MHQQHHDEYKDEIQINIYDLTGRTWLHQTGFGAMTHLNVHDLVAGIYLVEIAVNGQIARKKIVLE